MNNVNELHKKLKKNILFLEERIGVPPNFLFYLGLDPDDWSFIIKLHAFFETACTQLIISVLGKNELKDIMSRLPMRGKVIYMEKLNLLKKKARNYINKLSEIRNFFVHDITNISLKLNQYVESLDQRKLNGFIKAIGYNMKEKFSIIPGTIIEKDVFIKENPRLAIWMGANSVTFDIGSQMKVEIKEKELQKKEKDFLNKVLITLAKLKDFKK